MPKPERRAAQRAWILYDVANSAFVTTIVTAVFPVFYAKVAADGLPKHIATAHFGYATTLALALTAVLAPPLGLIADRRPIKKILLGAFMLLGVLSTALMPLIGPGDKNFALLLFWAANLGVAGSFVFYDALLPHIASDDEVHRVSTAGYAMGYLGGGLLLALNLAWIQKPEWFGIRDATLGTQLSFLSVAIWWLVFSLPLFFRVKEPAVPPREQGRKFTKELVSGLVETTRALRRYPQAWLMLIAFLIYNDGVQTIIRMATIYGEEIGLEASAMIAAVLLVQFVGIPFAFLFGWLAGRFGAKRLILFGLATYLLIALIGYRMTDSQDFFLLAILVGITQGGTQALSRSLFSQLIPAARSTEFFALFAVFEKFAGIFGPLLFSLFAHFTGSSRNAILVVALFFVIGGALLARVKVSEGIEAAKA